MSIPTITIKQIRDNDLNSWAVLVNNIICFGGLSKSSIPYYKKLALQTYNKRKQKQCQVL